MGQSTPIRRTGSEPLAGRSILIVEDEYFLADDLAGELKRRGADVIGPVSEVLEAQTILSSDQPIDAALLDINLRNEMIYPLARALRERDIRFAFTTGYVRTSIRSEFADVLLWEKPLDVPAVADGLAELLKGR
ncbi:putative response regulator receiver (CheY-like protein) [Bradyrhizobium sp. STM 3843]|uniref:response regulator n=1 Tax=Bradyrhizobium sp. STM 3843 TaxID=551947 RepID=UPI000240A93B|nr:response regulator [Bradyrhizobium sp. STM 3843]CCE06127.1 putative response regulator receiver (CheY-like protein) [Bradyrhizobium sp. STM 3843]